MLRCRARAAEVVRDDAVRVEVHRRPVDEDEPGSASPVLVEVPVIVTRRDDDQAVDAPLVERSDQLAFAMRVLVTAAGEDENAAFPRGVLDRTVKRRREG